MAAVTGRGAVVLAGEPVLRAVQEEFPGYRIWPEVVRDRTRYVACSRSVGARPHTLVTADLDELRAGLGAGPVAGSGPGGRT